MSTQYSFYGANNYLFREYSGIMRNSTLGIRYVRLTGAAVYLPPKALQMPRSTNFIGAGGFIQTILIFHLRNILCLLLRLRYNIYIINY